MCELYAINAPHPVRANDQLRRFYQDSVNHPHGWGVAWRAEDGVHLHKEGMRAIDSRKLQALLERPIVSRRVVAHIRNATKGVLSFENSHPFVLEDGAGLTWAIAHNGTLFDEHLTASYADQAQGNTDSERLALYLVDLVGSRARELGRQLTFDERFSLLEAAVEELSPQNKLNLLLDDGIYTYAHTNTLEPTLFERLTDGAAYLCTVPQDESGQWQMVPQNRLLAYCDGQQVRTGARHDHTIDEAAYFAAISSLPPLD